MGGFIFGSVMLVLAVILWAVVTYYDWTQRKRG